MGPPNGPLPSCCLPRVQNESVPNDSNDEFYLHENTSLISIWMIVHQVSLRDRGKQQLGNGLLWPIRLVLMTTTIVIWLQPSSCTRECCSSLMQNHAEIVKAVAVLKIDNTENWDAFHRTSRLLDYGFLLIFITRDQMGCIALKIAIKIFVKDLLVSLGRRRVILSRRNERRLLGFCNPTSIRPRREAGWAK